MLLYPFGFSNVYLGVRKNNSELFAFLSNSYDGAEVALRSETQSEVISWYSRGDFWLL